MSLFKKPNRKFRQRVTHSDSENEEDETKNNGNGVTSEVAPARPTPDHPRNNQSSSSAPVGHLNNNSSKISSNQQSNTNANSQLNSSNSNVKTETKMVTKLSFHDEDEEGEVFQVKKSNYSRRLAKQRERERKKRMEKMASKSPQLPNESTNTTNANNVTPEPSSVSNSVSGKAAKSVTSRDEPEEPKRDTDAAEAVPEAEVVQMELDSDGEEDQDKTDKSREEDIRLINQFRGALQSGVIPDAATIYALKKRRQLAREMGEFGPAEDPEPLHENKSRLIRDDDNDRSDDDGEEGRINFTVNTELLERQKAKEAFLSAQEEAVHGSGDEEAEELERWEQEQIRKGVSIPQVQPPSQPYQTEVPKYVGYEYPPAPFSSSVVASYVGLSASQKLTKRSTMVPQSKKDKGTMSTEAVRQRVSERLSAVTEARDKHKREYTMCQVTIRDAEETVDKVEKEAPILAAQFKLYQELRSYVADLVECINVKLPLIELLDQKMNALWKKRADQLVQRRRQDIKDQDDEFSFLCKRMMGRLGIDLAEDTYTTHDEVKLRRIAEREGRKMRRRKAREARQSSMKHYEGLSSDNEEADADLLKFAEEQDQILREAQLVFDDVVEEYSSLQSVKQRFEQWRLLQLDSYRDAYIPDCLPKLFSPFVRLELLGWNPLYESKDIENHSWYETLVFYGCTKDNIKNTIDDDDPDLNLVPTIVDRTVLPKLTKIVENVWDPMSTSQTIRLVNLVKKYLDDYPEVTGKSKRIQMLFQSVVTRICQALDDDVYVPLYPKELLENRTVNANAFFQRQFWSCAKLLRNILSWHGVLADKPLRELALNCLLNRYMLLGLQSTQGDVAEKSQFISAVLPRVWFSPSEDCMLPELEMFKKLMEAV